MRVGGLRWVNATELRASGPSNGRFHLRPTSGLMLQPRFDGMFGIPRSLPHLPTRLFQWHQNMALDLLIGPATEKSRVCAAIPAGRRFTCVVIGGERSPR